MLIGRVTGEVVATAKHASHSDLKLLLVEPLDLDDRPAGVPYVAVDVLDSGVGDRVLLATDGWAAHDRGEPASVTDRRRCHRRRRSRGPRPLDSSARQARPSRMPAGRPVPRRGAVAKRLRATP